MAGRCADAERMRKGTHRQLQATWMQWPCRQTGHCALQQACSVFGALLRDVIGDGGGAARQEAGKGRPPAQDGWSERDIRQPRYS